MEDDGDDKKAQTTLDASFGSFLFFLHMLIFYCIYYYKYSLHLDKKIKKVHL